MIEDRLANLETKVDALAAGQTELHTDVSELTGEMRSEFTAVRTEMRDSGKEMKRHMGVLHEDTIAKIRALAPDFGPIRREFQAANAELRKDVDMVTVALEKLARRKGR